MKITAPRDAYGMALRDAFDGFPAWEIVERRDGFVSVAAGPSLYLAEFEDWPRQEKWAMDFVGPRVLDLGCAAGRHSLYLQAKGHAVVAVDSSPLAVEVAAERGVAEVRVCDMRRLPLSLGIFDTILLMGNNGGLLGSPARGEKMLRFLGRFARPGTRILFQSLDPDEYPPALDTATQRNNIEQGRARGEIRIRIRHGAACTPWFDCWFPGPRELEILGRQTGWCLSACSEPWHGMFTGVLQWNQRA